MKKQFLLLTLVLCSTFFNLVGQVTYNYPSGPFAAPYDGDLIEADYWDLNPKILSAGVGFSDIVALEINQLNQFFVEVAGGAWLSDITCGTNDADFTTTTTATTVQQVFIYQSPPYVLQNRARGLDGLPIVFSWPVLSNTVDVTDFRFILNTGDTVTPYYAGMVPNYENNERNCVVVFGEFANRRRSNQIMARFPVKCEVVADATPLMLMGPNNQVVSAVGLSWTTNSSPYDPNNGPRLVGAKLNHIGTTSMGEGTSNALFNNFIGVLPNDEFALYGGGDFRLRMLTTGGFSPDGVRGIKPTEFERFFRIHATDPNGNPMLLDQVNTVYNVMGGTLKIIGLSDLGQSSSNYGDCYDEDRDNYIDIIIEGDEAAARNITHLEIPSLAGGYDPLYNPGGPGTTPFSGVTYTSPGPPDLEPVIIALDDPWRVSTPSSSMKLGVQDSRSDIVVYPSPATDQVEVMVKGDFRGSLEVYNMVGTRLLSATGTTIDTSGLKTGTYILVVKYADGKVVPRKFVKI